MHTQESGKGMKKLRNNKIRKLLAFMVALALMVSCMPSAYTISASEAFGDGTEDIFTDGEITSEPAAEESTPDVSSADQEETEQAQQSTLTYENDSVKVTAEALEDGALPQNTALKADSVNENSSVSYDTVSQKLSAAATDKGSSLRGFFAYDVYFADGDGNRVEPNGRVRVTFEYKTPAAPELTDAASTSVTVEKLHYNSSTGDTDVNTLQANEDLKVLNVNEGKQIQTLQVETGNAAVFAVMWDSPETADVEAEAVSGNEDEVPIASEELTDGMDISDEPEQDAAETPAAENPEVTPEEEPSEAPAENPDAEPTEAPAEDPDVVEEPAEDIASPEEVPAADENGETSLIEVLGDDTNLRVSPSIEAEVLATVNAGTQLTLLDTVTAEDGATWYKVSWEGTEAYIRSDMAQVVDSSDEAEEVEDVQEEEIQPEITRYDYKSDEVNVKVTLTDPADLPDNAELSVTPVELSQEAEDQITEEAIKENRAYLYVNKEVQRVSKKALEELDQKDVIVIFPEERKTNKTVRIMKTPKTESSVRKVFLPRSVAEELIAWKAQQEEIKDILQEEYQDYGLILATEYGGAYIRDSLNKLIKQHDLPQIVFHSFRHMSVTYKLKLNGGDIKAVQGDSGHAQADMVTEVYSHIIDEDRRRNATLLEDSFYNRKNLNPQIHDTEKRTMMEVPEGVDAELLAKVLSNPEMAVLLTSLAKSMQGEHN